MGVGKKEGNQKNKSKLCVELSVRGLKALQAILQNSKTEQSKVNKKAIQSVVPKLVEEIHFLHPNNVSNYNSENTKHQYVPDKKRNIINS